MKLGRLAISLPLPRVDARRCVELARRAENEWGYPAIWLAETSGPDSFALGGAALSDAMIDRIAIIGPAERCREQIAEFVAAGVTTPVISPLTIDPGATLATFQAFAPGLR